jgi:hypothetical protein
MAKDDACARYQLIESIEHAAEQASIAGVSVLAVIAALQAELARWQERFLKLQHESQ